MEFFWRVDRNQLVPLGRLGRLWLEITCKTRPDKTRQDPTGKFRHLGGRCSWFGSGCSSFGLSAVDYIWHLPWVFIRHISKLEIHALSLVERRRCQISDSWLAHMRKWKFPSFFFCWWRTHYGSPSKALILIKGSLSDQGWLVDRSVRRTRRWLRWHGWLTQDGSLLWPDTISVCHVLHNIDCPIPPQSDISPEIFFSFCLVWSNNNTLLDGEFPGAMIRKNSIRMDGIIQCESVIPS